MYCTCKNIVMMSNEAQSDFPGLIGQHLYPSVSTEEENCNGNDECLFFIYLANVIFCHLFQAPGGDRTQAERKSERALKRFFVRGSGCACGCRPSSRSTLAPSGEHTAGHSTSTRLHPMWKKPSLKRKTHYGIPPHIRAP